MHMADTVLLDDCGLKITAFQVNHEPVYPAVGYRFDYKGRSVVFSGDTIRWPNVVTHAANADVLIHEAQSEEAKRILVQAFRRNGQDQLAEVMTGTSATTPLLSTPHRQPTKQTCAFSCSIT